MNSTPTTQDHDQTMDNDTTEAPESFATKEATEPPLGVEMGSNDPDVGGDD